MGGTGGLVGGVRGLPGVVGSTGWQPIHPWPHPPPHPTPHPAPHVTTSWPPLITNSSSSLKTIAFTNSKDLLILLEISIFPTRFAFRITRTFIQSGL